MRDLRPEYYSEIPLPESLVMGISMFIRWGVCISLSGDINYDLFLGINFPGDSFLIGINVKVSSLIVRSLSLTSWFYGKVSRYDVDIPLLSSHLHPLLLLCLGHVQDESTVLLIPSTQYH